MTDSSVTFSAKEDQQNARYCELRRARIAERLQAKQVRMFQFISRFLGNGEDGFWTNTPGAATREYRAEMALVGTDLIAARGPRHAWRQIQTQRQRESDELNEWEPLRDGDWISE